MENRGEVQMRIWLLVIVFSGLGFSIASSSSSTKVGTSDPNINSFSTSKYIMKSYYERYEQLDDSYYQDYIAQELPFGLCDIQQDNPNLVPRLIILNRKLIGEGSHRHLSSSIRIRIQPKSITETSHCNCGVILIERLPVGVFADPFELQHLLQRGVFNDVAVFGDTNLELPSFLSNRSVVEVHMDINPGISRDKNEIDIKFELPLHARYAPLNESGYSEVVFGAPDLFLRCSIERESLNQTCLYAIATDDAELQYGAIVWKIPSGIKAHAGVVYVFTFVSAFLAALVIVLTSIFRSSSNTCKSSKQS